MTMTVWLQLELLPLQSVAVQVRVCVPVPGQAPGAKASVKVTTGLGSQTSVAVGAGNTGVAGHWIGEVVAGQVIVGGVVSMTTTVWLQLALLPEQSVAVHVRVLLYVPGQDPGVVTSTNVTTGAGSHVSVAAGGGNTGVAGHWIGEGAAGQTITGGVVSITATVWEQLAELPLQSVHVQVRVLV